MYTGGYGQIRVMGHVSEAQIHSPVSPNGVCILVTCRYGCSCLTQTAKNGDTCVSNHPITLL
jgi:hypothetical protein